MDKKITQLKNNFLNIKSAKGKYQVQKRNPLQLTEISMNKPISNKQMEQIWEIIM